jgi:hypothetical protein
MSRGLTLVEVIITVGLAALLGIPVGVLLSEHLGGALRARDYTVAMSLARSEAERLDSLNDFFHPDLNVTQTDVFNYLNTPYTLRREVTCVEGNCTAVGTGSQGVKRITITVYKPSATDLFASVVATLATYRTKHVSFGN